METIIYSLLIIILSGLLIFHFCIVLKLVDYRLVWGGRLRTDQEMYRFEVIAILLNALILILTTADAGIFELPIPTLATSIFRWVVAVLFSFNTLGNFLSKNKLEKRLFTPLTLVLAVGYFLLIFLY